MTQAYTLAGASVHDLEAPSGAVYRLLLYVPVGLPPALGWPLLMMTDGNSCFGTAVDALRAQADYPKSSNVGWGVVAALGYPTENAYDPLRRSWDLSPPPGRRYPPFTSGGPEVRTGGADEFLDFIESRVIPFITSRVKIDLTQRTLFGHSFGGLFGLYTLFRRPALFQRIVAVSPTIHWEDCTLLRSEAQAEFNVPIRPTVYLSAGEHEGDQLAPFQEKQDDASDRLAKKKLERTIDFAREMAERLRDPNGANLSANFEIFADHTHMSVPTPATARAVQVAFALDQHPTNGTALVF
ncbi:alpha/beta hydrolase [Microvirga lotononidis]|uniref:Putative hydrolase of alpha/beta superfamily n=1 Tax=Microvirga lotononidis TaxID=864069 RepID=I4Z1T8_9HYPH|nr:alpha/beta hydrolase-fold protein [Microvirga lotononidis]EIM30180.1 putative hydrolase of alpha/beta superfamily [Microvirga lotononidis]WQO31594.1 alpha/beta hydrolase-fold protein [Microvirga lotononidis]